MEFNAMVEAIAARVAQQLALEEAQTAQEQRLPQLLLLTMDHGTCCHEILESPRLKARYQTTCALLEGYDCDPAAFDTVLVYGLDLCALGKIASGICDTPYAALAVRAILLGKKLIIIRDEVELFHYGQTAPPAFYEMMLEKIHLLEQSGVVFCGCEETEEILLGNVAAVAVPPPVQKTVTKRVEKEQCISKRVITEKDIAGAFSDGVTVLHIEKKGILTDLAKDYARERGIEVIRG